MRPVPRKQHLLAALILLAVAAGFGYQAFLDTRLSASQMHIASVALKRHQPELFVHDPLLGKAGLWQFYTPAFQGVLEQVLVPSGYEDLTLPFRLLTGFVVLIYLFGMYVLLYHQCKSWAASAFVSVLSCRIMWTLGWSYWGAGSLGSMAPSTMAQAMVPLIVLSYLRYERQWRVLLVFAFIGACGNLHLVTAMNLTLVLLGVYLGSRRFRPSSWAPALGCGACALLGAAPFVWFYFATRAGLAPPGAQTSALAVAQALQTAGLDVLYPTLFKPLLEWGPWAGLLALPAVAVLGRIERFRLRNAGVWMWFLISGVVVAFVLQGASQLIGILSGKAPLAIDFANAASLLMLPLYVLLAQGLTNLFRLIHHKGPRTALRWACAALMGVWLVPSDNLRFVRHRVYDVATAFMAQADKPRNIQRHHHRRRRRAELAEIANWARTNTEIGAVFLTDRIEFRMLSRRAIVASGDDVKYVYYMAPWSLEAWLGRVNQLSALLYPPGGRADPAAIKQFVGELAQEEQFASASSWYVILPAAVAPGETGMLEAVESGTWGAAYRLYKVR